MYDNNNSITCDHSTVAASSSHCIEDVLVNVHLSQNLNIPSNMLITVSGMINNGIKDNANLLIYPNVIKKSIVLASALTHTMSSNATIQLANLSGKEITLNSEIKLSEGIYVDSEQETIAKLDVSHQTNFT